jgi:hypothetical protein
MLEKIWVGTFKNKSGKEQILVYETYCDTDRGPMMTIVPAMTVKQDRFAELLPEWQIGAKKLGVTLEVICFERCKEVHIASLISSGVF